MKFNKQDYDILKILLESPMENQRMISEVSGYSVGGVNKSLKNLKDQGLIGNGYIPTEKARVLAKEASPRNAIILAAGLGLRMAPIAGECHKALLEAHGEIMIERQIRQLREAGVEKIYVIVGYLKEEFDYLIDQYGVELIYNSDYSRKNNLHSVALALEHIDNSYIIPCDLWCEENPFSPIELYSWYMVSDRIDEGSTVRITRKNELEKIKKGDLGNHMIGIAYLTGAESNLVKEKIALFDKDKNYDDCFWEEAIYTDKRAILYPRLVTDRKVTEIDTYEQLRDFDEGCTQLKSDVMDLIAGILKVSVEDVQDIEIIKKGMTNSSFIFRVDGRRYIMRIPRRGSEFLVNHIWEAEIYKVIEGRDICDDVLYLDPKTGYKLSVYMEGARECDPHSESDLKICMEKLRSFHRMKLPYQNYLDLYDQMLMYERLWEDKKSIFRDHEEVTEKVLSLKPFVYAQKPEIHLVHIDPNPDNLLITKKADGTEEVHIIDWENSGAQNYLADLASFGIYAFYEKEETDHLLELYFEGQVKDTDRAVVYCLCALYGLMWSNWAEYKQQLGFEFGDYILKEYRLAKKYYRYACELIEELKK